MSYYPRYRCSSNNIKVELDLSNYATKDDVTGFFLYEYHNDLVYDCKLNLIKTYFYGMLDWNPKNIYHPSNKNMLNSVPII